MLAKSNTIKTIKMQKKLNIDKCENVREWERRGGGGEEG